MASSTPPQGYGRGGRGALLLAALKSQARRPGEAFTEEKIPVETATVTERTSELEKQEQVKCIGRGALLQTLLAQGRGRSAPVPSERQTSKDDIGALGRGRSVQVPSEVRTSSEDIGGRGSAITKMLHGALYAPKSSSETVVGTKSLGRGALTSEKLPLGRGLMTHTSRATLPSPSAAAIDVRSSDTRKALHSAVEQHLPPTEKLEKLSIKQYSGSSGETTNFEVNYVRLIVQDNKGIYEYHVSFNPPIDSKNMRFKLLNQPELKEIIGNVRTFDGSKLYLPVKLVGPATNVVTKLPTDGSAVTVCVKFITVCQPKDCLHLYNVLFRRIMHILKMTQVGRNYYDPSGGIPVPEHKLEIWPGYVTAIQEYEGGIMLNCDSSFRVLRTVTAKDIFYEAHAARGNVKDTIEKELIGSIILTRYNNKTYRVDDIAWDLNPNSEFTFHTGQKITYKEYYKRSYDIVIKELDQPLLINKPKRKALEEKDKFVCLIPELSYMTGLTDAMRNDYRVMKDVAVHTRITPNKRHYALQRFIDNVNNSPEAKKALADWNLKLDSAAISLDGRILRPEEIFLGNKSFFTNKEADWGRNITQDPVLVPVNLENWIIVFTKRDSSKAQEFIAMLKKVCPAMGIRVRDPIRCEISNDRTETFLATLRDAVNPSVQVAVVIFPTPRDDRYSAVKKLCCVEMPVPSQVINAKTISQYQKLRSVTQKIALQINCKLGGELWSLHIPLQNIMVCGLDTYHDLTHGRRSVLGFVASINQSLTRWFSVTSFQQSGQELGDSLKTSLISAIRKYHEVNHKLPDKIFVYRDGVGDGQLDYVAQYEVEQLSTCFKHFRPDYMPLLSVIVVQKRINTRLFQHLNSNGRNNLENPPPGSVMDHTITRKKWYDFFLVSQHVRQGTVSPTHYVIVCDNNHLKPDYMQRLAYKMTHLYYNWPGTVRVPAPCQYAHKLAHLVGQSVHKEPHVALADKLFFL